MNLKPQDDPEAIRIGRDLVRIEEGAVVIYSLHDMPDWVAREYKRPVITFRGHKFYLRAREPQAKPFRWRYVLWPWPEDDHQLPPYEIIYDEEYVRERDQDGRDRTRAELVHSALLPFYPLLGFLWFRTKNRLVDYGFNPHSLTSMSVAVEFGFMLLWGIFVGWLGTGTTKNYIVLGVLVADVVFRYDAVLGNKPIQPGFLEWLVRR